MRLKAFRALRPRPDLAACVASVPYDVVSRAEAVVLAEGNPYSFLHVGRSDIDLPAGADPHDPRIYAGARAALDRLIAEGALLRDREPALFVYRQVMNGRAQTGVVGCVHVDDYERDVIRKHEKTRKDKEDDRTRHVLTLNAHAEPVFLTYRPAAILDRLAQAATSGPALYDFTAPDGVRHSVWRASDAARGSTPSLRSRLPMWPTATIARPAHGARDGNAGRPIPVTPAPRSTTGSSRCSFPATSCGFYRTTGW